jgi:hypothetical protein
MFAVKIGIGMKLNQKQTTTLSTLKSIIQTPLPPRGSEVCRYCLTQKLRRFELGARMKSRINLKTATLEELIEMNELCMFGRDAIASRELTRELRRHKDPLNGKDGNFGLQMFDTEEMAELQGTDERNDMSNLSGCANMEDEEDEAYYGLKGGFDSMFSTG